MWNWGAGRTMLSLKALILSSSCWLLAVLSFTWLVALSPLPLTLSSRVHLHSGMCLSLNLSKDTTGAMPTKSSVTSSTFNYMAKTIFPNKVTLIGIGRLGLQYIFGEDTIQLTILGKLYVRDSSLYKERKSIREGLSEISQEPHSHRRWRRPLTPKLPSIQSAVSQDTLCHAVSWTCPASEAPKKAEKKEKKLTKGRRRISVSHK